jgi:hypothetical protein
MRLQSDAATPARKTDFAQNGDVARRTWRLTVDQHQAFQQEYKLTQFGKGSQGARNRVGPRLSTKTNGNFNKHHVDGDLMHVLWVYWQRIYWRDSRAEEIRANLLYPKLDEGSNRLPE